MVSEVATTATGVAVTIFTALEALATITSTHILPLRATLTPGSVSTNRVTYIL